MRDNRVKGAISKVQPKSSALYRVPFQIQSVRLGDHGDAVCKLTFDGDSSISDNRMGRDDMRRMKRKEKRTLATGST